MNPSYIFRKLVDEEQPRSIILTSGTLSPMKILYTELRTHFKVKLVNEHFIEDHRVFATIIKEDLHGNELKFNFENKDMKKSYREVGFLLYRIEKKIKGGILIFFTSYTHLHDCYASWLESGLTFGKNKVFHEEKEHEATMKNYEAYIKYVKETNSGIFLCVCRGKLSESLNFSDNLARACVVVGIPYFLVQDSRVILKKNYLDENWN